MLFSVYHPLRFLGSGIVPPFSAYMFRKATLNVGRNAGIEAPILTFKDIYVVHGYFPRSSISSMRICATNSGTWETSTMAPSYWSRAFAITGRCLKFMWLVGRSEE